MDIDSEEFCKVTPAGKLILLGLMLALVNFIIAPSGASAACTGQESVQSEPPSVVEDFPYEAWLIKQWSEGSNKVGIYLATLDVCPVSRKYSPAVLLEGVCTRDGTAEVRVHAGVDFAEREQVAVMFRFDEETVNTQFWPLLENLAYICGDEARVFLESVAQSGNLEIAIDERRAKFNLKDSKQAVAQLASACNW